MMQMEFCIVARDLAAESMMCFAMVRLVKPLFHSDISSGEIW